MWNPFSKKESLSDNLEKPAISVTITGSFNLSTKVLMTILGIIATLLGVSSALNPENISPQLPEVKIEQMELEKK